MKDIKVGDRVFIEVINARHESSREAIVEKVGNKYFEVGRNIFLKETGYNKPNDYGHCYTHRAWKSQVEYQLYLDTVKMREKLKEVALTLPYEDLFNVFKLLNINTHE